MQLFNALALLAAAFSVSDARPTPESDAVAPKFHVISKAISGPNPKYGGLYMYASHTGAGFNVPGFFRGTTGTPPEEYRLNNTRLLTNLGGKFPYGLAFGQVEDLYAAWGAMTLNAGDGQTGFSINDNGYIVASRKDIVFGGWRICDWVHGYPELYYNTQGKFSRGVQTSNCELVHLVAEYI